MDALDRNLSSDELSRHGRMPYNIVGWAFFFFFPFTVGRLGQRWSRDPGVTAETDVGARW